MSGVCSRSAWSASLRAARWKPPVCARSWGRGGCGPAQVQQLPGACVLAFPWGLSLGCGSVFPPACLGQCLPRWLDGAMCGRGLLVQVFQAPLPRAFESVGLGWGQCSPTPGRQGKRWSSPTLSHVTGGKTGPRPLRLATVLTSATDPAHREQEEGGVGPGGDDFFEHQQGALLVLYLHSHLAGGW